VGTPGEYPWSTYHFNALGQYDSVTVPHSLYERLGRRAEEWRAAYRELFDLSIEEQMLRDIRESTNKGWALGDDRFLKQIEQLTQRQTAPRANGGDRHSKKFQKTRRVNRPH